MNQYPKAIKSILVGVLYYVAKKYLGLGDLLSDDFMIYIDIALGGLVAYLFGRYTRMTTAEAKYVEDLRQ